MKRRHHTRTTRWLLCLLLTFAGAQACGPDFSPDVFVRSYRPDLPKQYAAGKLGLLQSGFARADLVVAYRYLNGGTLDAQEQAGWSPTYSAGEQEQDWAAESSTRSTGAASEPTAVDRWTKTRGLYPDAPKAASQYRDQAVKTASGFEYNDSFLNCNDDAFRTAADVLAKRAKLWGKDSPFLRDWLHGQDAVFSNCKAGSTWPDAASGGSPRLLVQDRAYQDAAAHFYAQDFPAAQQKFLAISRDASSPWQPISGYLVARALVRQAFVGHAGSLQWGDVYDAQPMHEAEGQLRAYLSGNPPPELRRAADAELALVRIRLEPEERARELSALLSGPAHDPHYDQDLKDLIWYIGVKTPDGLRAEPEYWDEIPDPDHPGQTRPATEAEESAKVAVERHNAYAGSAGERQTPLVDWVLTMQSLDPSAGTHASAQWRSTHALPWLVAALAKDPADGKAPVALLDAASTIAPDSPAWQSVTYHRVRLLLAAGQAEQARSVLADAMPRLGNDAGPSSVNAFRGLEMAAASTLPGFLEFVPRTILLQTSEEAFAVGECDEVMKDPKRHYNCVPKVDPSQLDQDAAGIFNRRAPLSVWLEAAQSDKLSPQLRQAIAMVGWTRAVLLHDESASAAFLPLLPADLKKQADGDRFQRLVALVHNPGLNPYLNGGTQRGYAYDFVESFRDNWCYQPAPSPEPSLVPAFLGSAERKAGDEQAKALAKLTAVSVGQQVIDYVRAHPETPRAAESLYLVLRMVRYGCSGNDTDFTVIQKQAARLLRQRYATSPWTKKAAPIAG